MTTKDDYSQSPSVPQQSGDSRKTIQQKKHTKAKQVVSLRTRRLASGNDSLFLDYIINGERQYEFLKLYLIPRNKPNAKALNNETMRAANAIRAQRQIEIINGIANIKTNRSTMLLIDLMEAYRAKQATDNYKGIIKTATNWLTAYAGPTATLKDVDKAFCVGFITYLQNTPSKRGKTLSTHTAREIYTIFNTVLNKAVREGVLAYNPNQRIDRNEKIKVADSTREYLTIDELRLLLQDVQENGTEVVKQAFLFSCFCGLRYSDIIALRWGDIEQSRGECMAKVVMQKTKRANYIPLSSNALSWLPARGNEPDEAPIFNLPTPMTISNKLKRWASTVGITKNITFHTARHTFATALLTKGADLFTTSKLLGHTNVKTTQIYAKIVDTKKREAVDSLNDIMA